MLLWWWMHLWPHHLYLQPDSLAFMDASSKDLGRKEVVWNIRICVQRRLETCVCSSVLSCPPKLLEEACSPCWAG